MNERYQHSALSILAATHHKLSRIFVGPHVVFVLIILIVIKLCVTQDRP